MTKQKHSNSKQRRVKTVACYLEEIKDITAQGTAYAYRGQADAGWELESGVARRIRAASPASTSSKQSATQPIKSALEMAYEQLLPDSMMQYQNNLLTEARRKGFGVVDGRKLLDLELLTELQHFGAETCLLDFTESALVALYFACRNEDCEDGKIFCVPQSNILPVPEDKSISVLLRSGKPYRWQPIMCGEAERRIICQDGLFFINLPPDLGDLEEIIIQADGKEEILKELKSAHQISAEKLFIDLSGFAQNQASGREWEEYWALLYSGVAKNNSGDPEAAIADYDEAIGLQPNYADAYYNRGNAKADQGQYEAAIVDYDKAIGLQRDNAWTYTSRGIAKGNLGQYEAAIADFDEAIRRNTGYAKAYDSRGVAKARQGQVEAAIADFGDAIRLQPDYANAYKNRGVAWKELGNKKRARADLEKALRLAKEQNLSALVVSIREILDELNVSDD